MKIAVIEIMPFGHMTLAESIARIYASDSTNEIIIYTHQKGFDTLNKLQKNYSNIKIITKESNTSILHFLKIIAADKHDKLYVVTLEKYYKEWLSVDFKCPEYIVVHNIYGWFISQQTSAFRGVLSDFIKFNNLLYALKLNFVYPAYRKKIIKKCQKSKGKFVVINTNIADELSNFISRKEIQIIPFSIYDKNLSDKSSSNKKLRICIPGILSQTRRDYFGFINLLHSDPRLKDLVEIDFLGGHQAFEQGDEVFAAAKQIRSEGFEISIYDSPMVPLYEFDEQLTKADIILGNMHVEIDKNNIYGKSKDSGIVFTMIRNAKPGILPLSYTIMPEMVDSTITYNSENELKEIILELATNRDKINSLKTLAFKNALKFTPEAIYSGLQKQ